MSESFFDQLRIPAPTVNLDIGSGSHAQQTGGMLTAIEKYLMSRSIDAVLTYGDTNSTLAATLAASKIHVPVAHIEAGLRSYNRAMPEEINRVVADHCSDRLYAPTPLAMSNLERENLLDRAVQTGDVMLDAVLDIAQVTSGNSKITSMLGLENQNFGLVTVHRPANTSVEALSRILDILETLSSRYLKLVFPVHPRTRVILEQLDRRTKQNLLMVEPLTYFDSIAVMQAARLVITDSGGVQKEAAFLRTPCITIRDETEWMETVDLGINRLVGTSGDQVVHAVESVLSSADPFDGATIQELTKHFGSGEASHRIAEDCARWLGETCSRKRRSRGRNDK
jgi:UDP-N-acetylglucosamine 2-epimerase